MKNEQQNQNLLLKVNPRSTFRNNFLQPATNAFVARQVDHARWKTGNINKNFQRNNVARQVEGFCVSYFAALSLGPVHTNPFPNVNGAVLLRIRLSSTLQRRKPSPKTGQFENAPQSAAIWKRCFLKTLFSSAIWKRWRHQIDVTGRQTTVSIQNGGQTLPRGLSLDQRCSVDGRKRYETDKWGRKSFWKRSKTAPFSFENGLVWTEPQCI